MDNARRRLSEQMIDSMNDPYLVNCLSELSQTILCYPPCFNGFI
jgi:hypothetical protein